MKIGLISDTHSPQMGSEPPPQVARAFAGVDLILHAGDIYSPECLDALELIAPVLAVELSPARALDDSRVIEKRRVVQVGGYSIGLTHDLMFRGIDGGEVVPGIIGRRFPPDHSLSSALEDVFGEPVDTVVFGHTHVSMLETHQDILFVNPGSPTLPKQIDRLGSVGIMELTSEGPEAWLVELAEFDE